MALLLALFCACALGAAASPTPHELAARELELRARELDLRERELELRERELEALQQQQPRAPKPLKTFGTGLAGFLANTSAEIPLYNYTLSPGEAPPPCSGQQCSPL